MLMHRLENDAEQPLDALSIGDSPQHADKKFQRKILNKKLSDLFDQLQKGRDELRKLLAAPAPAAPSSPAPVVAGR